MADIDWDKGTITAPRAAAPDGEVDWDGGVITEPPPKTGAVRRLADVALSFGQGVVGGTKSITDAAGAGNAVSSTLNSAQDALGGMLSPARQAEKAARAEKIRAAEASGSTLQEVGAHLGGFIEAPVSSVAEGLGSIAPTVAAAMLPGGQAATVARGAAMLGLGAAQGAGSVKGSIYDSVKNQHLQAGATPEAAEAAAQAAQAYDGPNAGNIATGAALGAVAGRVGAEGAVARSVSGQPVASAARRIASGMATEGATEAAQGTQESISI